MHGHFNGSAARAIIRADRTGSISPRLAQTVSPSEATDQTDSEGDKWFCELARRLLPKDAGFVLHLETGFEERTCYRYVSGERKPPGYFIRELLRSPSGWQWLCGLMEGSDAEWFEEIKRAKRKSAAYDAA